MKQTLDLSERDRASMVYFRAVNRSENACEVRQQDCRVGEKMIEAVQSCSLPSNDGDNKRKVQR